MENQTNKLTINTQVNDKVYNQLDSAIATKSNADLFLSKVRVTVDKIAHKSLEETLGLFAKFTFDCELLKRTINNLTEVKTVSFTCSTGKYYGKSFLVSINYPEQTVKVHHSGAIYNCREYILLSFKANKQAKTGIAGLYTTKEALYFLERTIPFCKSKASLEFLLELCVSKIFVDRGVQAVTKGRPYYGLDRFVEEGSNIETQRWVMETNKVSALGVYLHNTDDKPFAGFRAAGLAPCKSSVEGKHFKIVAEAFSKINEPVFCDKNASKYFYIKDGARAAGVDYLDNGTLITFNNADPEKPAKLLNRWASHNCRVAKVSSINSQLRIALSNGKYTYSSGVDLNTVVLFSYFNDGSGVAVVNDAIEFDTEKTLVKEINIDRFDPEYFDSLGTTHEARIEGLCAAIYRHLLEYGNTVIAGNTAIEFQGIEIAKNNRFFPITINSEIGTLREVVKPSGYTFNDEARLIKITLRGYARAKKKNIKLRSMHKKCTTRLATSENFKLTGGNGNPIQDWDIVLNPECIKGSGVILEMYANSFYPAVVEWHKGKLYKDKVEITQLALQQWVEVNSNQTYIVSRLVSEYTYQEFKDYKGDFFRFEPAEIEGYYWLHETCKGIRGWNMYQVEVSTADENIGASSLGIAEQYILSMAKTNVSQDEFKFNQRLQSLSQKELKDADLLMGKSSKVFNLNQPEDIAALQDLLEVNNTQPRTKEYLGALASKTIDGIRVEYTMAQGKSKALYTWSVEIPFGILLRFGNWDQEGKALTSFMPYAWNDDAQSEVTTSNILEDCFDLIEILKQKPTEDIYKSYFVHWSGFFSSWLNSIRTGNTASKIVKAGNTWHAKVLTDYSVGDYSYVNKKGETVKLDVPSIVIPSDSPLLKVNATNVSGAKANLEEGDAVMLHRNPLPLFTACIVKIDYSGNYDPGMVVVNPIVWSKATLGDADGDLAYLVPCKQYGISRNFAIKYNQGIIAQAGHWHYFSKGANILKSDSNIATIGKVSPIEDFLAVAKVGNDLVVGAAKPTGEIIKSWTEISNTISLNNLAKLAADVYNHYNFGVGKLYNFTFELTRQLGDNFYLNQALPTELEYLSLLEAIVIYEEVGLSGYSKKNADFIAAIDLASETNQVSRPVRVSKFRQQNGIATSSKVLVEIDSVKYDFSKAYIEAVKRVKQARKVQAGKLGNVSQEILAAGAVRNLTRKSVDLSEALVYQIITEGGGLNNSRFGRHINTIGKLRSTIAIK